MRPIFKKIPLFVVILILVLIFMNHWMDRESYPHYPLQYDEVFHPKVNANVVIFGASHATHGINPKYLESDHLKVFNFALNGANPLFYLKWYKEIFRRYYRRPSYVIYGVHWGMFDESILGRTLEQDSKYFPLDLFFQESRDVHVFKTLLLSRFALVRERRHLLERLFKRKQREDFLISKYYNGFIPFEVKRALTHVVDPKHSSVQIKAFEELLDEFERDKLKVIFVQVPGYLPGFDSPKITESVQRIHQIAEKRKIPFLDYEMERKSAINTNSSFFSDCFHLNHKGSEAFSILLGKDLYPYLM